MDIVVHIPWDNAPDWIEALRRHGRDVTIHAGEPPPQPDAVVAAIAYNAPSGFYRRFANLKAIVSPAAGVDHLLKIRDELPSVPVARLIDPVMADRMAQFMVFAVTRHMRGFHGYERQSAAGLWKRNGFRDVGDATIGVMGLGAMGRRTAEVLRDLGHSVIGWARSPKSIPGVPVHAGDSGLEPFLRSTDILICLLPLTSGTADILDRRRMALLKPGAAVINAGRGEHVVDADLLELLESGHLSGATLDVFRTEPLPADHPFWGHPGILVTPHIASTSNPESGAPQMLDTIRAILKGGSPDTLVHMDREY